MAEIASRNNNLAGLSASLNFKISCLKREADDRKHQYVKMEVKCTDLKHEISNTKKEATDMKQRVLSLEEHIKYLHEFFQMSLKQYMEG